MSTISRRTLIKGVAVATAVRFSLIDSIARTSDTLPRKSHVTAGVSEKVAERFRPLPFEAQQIEGLLAERMATNIQGRLLHVNEHALLAGFRGDDKEGEWIGEHVGKFLDAACNAARYSGDARLQQMLDRVAVALIASQQEDGYLGTYTKDKRWTSWDVWVHKYNLIGLLSYYEYSGNPAALLACKRIGDLLIATFGDEPGKTDIVDHGLHVGMAATSILEPICTLYRMTGEPQYLEFARYIVRSYEHSRGPHIVSSLLEHGSVYRTANAKAYEMLSNLNGILDLYRLTGERDLLTAVTRAWQNIVDSQLYCTGTQSAREHFQPSNRLLSLQPSEVGETCVTVTWLQLNWRLLRLTGEPRYGHEIERTVYNHLLGAQDPHTGDICYYTSLAGRKEYTSEILCCVSSGPRGISLIPQLVWGTEDNALFVNLYTAGSAQFEIKGVPVKVRSETLFPRRGDVTLTIDPQRRVPFVVRLRVPDWATSFEVGKGSDKPRSGRRGEMLDIDGVWEPSSTLTIRMALPVKVLPNSGSHKEHAALQRGPQILAIESVVNPAVFHIHRVALPHSSGFADLTELERPPSEWRGNQVYEMDAVIGVPADGDELRQAEGKVRLVPFADAANYNVLISPAGRLRRDRPAATAFCQAYLSMFDERLEPISRDYVETDISEFLIDEEQDTFCCADLRDKSALKELKRKSTEDSAGFASASGDTVWFSVLLKKRHRITHVTFRHGALTEKEGWFSTSAGKPRVEVAVHEVRNLGRSYFPILNDIDWKQAAVFEQYPEAGDFRPSTLADGQMFEVQLPDLGPVYAIRVIGKPGKMYVTCAELSAYGTPVEEGELRSSTEL